LSGEDTHQLIAIIFVLVVVAASLRIRVSGCGQLSMWFYWWAQQRFVYRVAPKK